MKKLLLASALLVGCNQYDCEAEAYDKGYSSFRYIEIYFDKEIDAKCYGVIADKPELIKIFRK